MIPKDLTHQYCILSGQRSQMTSEIMFRRPTVTYDILRVTRTTGLCNLKGIKSLT